MINLATSFIAYRKKYHIPVGYKEIQAMITNEVFYYKYELSGRKYERFTVDSVENKLFVLESFMGSEKMTRQTIQIDEVNFSLRNTYIVDYEDRLRVNLTYEDYSYHGEKSLC